MAIITTAMTRPAACPARAPVARWWPREEEGAGAIEAEEAAAAAWAM